MDQKTNDKPAAPLDDEALDFDKSADAPDEPLEDAASRLEHRLTKPIQAHGDEVMMLRWREPTGGDIERVGSPVQLMPTGDGGMTIGMNERKMSAMISVLAGIPPSSVRMLTAKDWAAVAWKLFGFFTPPGA